MAKEQSDNHTDRAYQYDMPDKATVLATDGEDKNVLNFESNSVYQVSNSDEARARLDRLIKRTDADFDNPIIAKKIHLVRWKIVFIFIFTHRSDVWCGIPSRLMTKRFQTISVMSITGRKQFIQRT